MKTKFIAITGGIGSGKSTACEILKNKGFAVYSADEVYKELLLNEDFVKGIYSAVGVDEKDCKTFNRKAVSNAVFNDKGKLEKLNAFTHKKIMDKMFSLSKNEKVVFHEVPLLFESGYQNCYDRVIIIDRPVKDRINSVAIRDGLSKEEITLRINNQFNYENLSKDRHTVIMNDKDIKSLTCLLEAVLSEINL